MRAIRAHAILAKTGSLAGNARVCLVINFFLFIKYIKGNKQIKNTDDNDVRALLSADYDEGRFSG